MKITRGKIQSAQKIVLYGPEGIGKSTFAAQFPDPLFIDTEGSTKHMDVARFDKPTSWAMLNEQVEYVKQNKPCKTLVVDTFDWAEQLCIAQLCATHQKKGIEEFGYGNGYVYEKEEIGRFLNKLDELINLGINIVLTCHAHLKKFEQPDEMGAYDRWELKLGKKTGSQISPLVKEWADAVLFANYKTFTVQNESKKNKAQGGRRVMYTSHHPCWDAKNRYGLDTETEFSYDVIAPYITGATSQAPVSPINPNDFEELPPLEDPPFQAPDLTGIPKELVDLMTANKVTPEEIQWAVSDTGYFPESVPVRNYPLDFIQGCLVGAWPQVFAKIEENRKVPF